VDELQELTELFARLGAPRPESWARSQLEEGIPQLARFVFLRQAVNPPSPLRLAPLAQGKPADDPNFICFEPLAAIVNGLNLAHRGLYKELQSIPPGGTWAASFWIRTSGF
jgi:hypothetical protein